VGSNPSRRVSRVTLMRQILGQILTSVLVLLPAIVAPSVDQLANRGYPVDTFVLDRCS